MAESLHNRIRVLQRRAYGHRDEQYLGLKIVAGLLSPSRKSDSGGPP